MSICPICEQGTVDTYSVLSKKEVIYLCEECEALWLSTEILDANALSLDNFIKERGLPPDWSGLSKIV